MKRRFLSSTPLETPASPSLTPSLSIFLCLSLARSFTLYPSLSFSLPLTHYFLSLSFPPATPDRGCLHSTPISDSPRSLSHLSFSPVLPLSFCLSHLSLLSPSLSHSVIFSSPPSRVTLHCHAPTAITTASVTVRTVTISNYHHQRYYGQNAT